ncbi:MAG: hypothetical protein JW904_09955 [Spirochaetales bacterium]|nr:hypothetical protein [Spirochaetales bacterium]
MKNKPAFFISLLFFSSCIITPDTAPEYGIPGYPGMTHFAWQSVMTQDRQELVWDGYYSVDSPEKVISYYKIKLSGTAFTFNASGESFKDDPVNPTVVLTLLTPTDPGPHTAFKDKIPASAKSVLIFSRMMNRRK